MFLNARIFVIALAAAAGAAQAADYTLWVKGRGDGGAPGNHQDWTYWGPPRPAGTNPRTVNWDGRSRIATQNRYLRDALDCYCTGPNWCTIAAYSAGDAMIGYALDLYGASQRRKKTPQPDAAGRCTDSDGSTQAGWNIKRVHVAAGAAGGTELADLGAWAVSEPLVADLKTKTMRAMYNHNETRGVPFFMYAGSNGSVQSALLPGQDDGIIAYHSSGGVSGRAGKSYCNPGDWRCDDLTLGSAPNQDGRAKWANHSVRFRDDGEDYRHQVEGQWAGIVARMLQDIAPQAGR